MDTIKVARQLLQRESFSELIPYLAYDDESKVYALDDGIGFCLECTPMRIAGSDTVATLRGIFESSAIPSNTCIQIMLLSTSDIKHDLDQYVMLREIRNGNDLFTDFCKKRRDFYLEGTKKSILTGFDYRFRNFRLIVSVKLPVAIRTPEEFQSAKKKAMEVKSNIAQSLKTANMNPSSMGLYPYSI